MPCITHTLSAYRCVEVKRHGICANAAAGFCRAVRGCVLAALRHSKRPLSRAAQSAFGGIAALAAVDVLAGYTGVALALNYATAFVAVVLGAPGVVMLLLLRAVLVL